MRSTVLALLCAGALGFAAANANAGAAPTPCAPSCWHPRPTTRPWQIQCYSALLPGKMTVTCSADATPMQRQAWRPRLKDAASTA